MKSSIRPTTPDDIGSVRAFLKTSFGLTHDAPFLDPAVMAWKYWDPREDWVGPRAFVLERNGVILAHAGLWPLTARADDITGVHMIDWAAARESPGAGLTLVQKLTAMFDYVFSIGGSEMTRKLLPAFGFVEYARQWKAARPLRPFRQFMDHQGSGLKRAPRLARNLLWSHLPTGRRPDGGWRAEPVRLGDSSGGGELVVADEHFSPRRAPFFEYLQRCPVMAIRLFKVWDRAAPKGHFAIGVLRGQARVAGIWMASPEADAWSAAYLLAQDAARRIDGAHEVVIAGTRGSSEALAAHAGLRIVGSVPVYLLNRKGNLTLPPDFQFQLSDNDALFFDEGLASYWT